MGRKLLIQCVNKNDARSCLFPQISTRIAHYSLQQSRSDRLYYITKQTRCL